jgi:cytochrome b
MSSTERPVWDLPVRLFHWSLAAAVVTAFVTDKLGVSYFKYHLWSGYTVLVLVAFRILWGFVGTRHARFWNFVRGPAETVRYAVGLVSGSARHYPGHNPLGALMVLALLVALGAQATLGLFGDDDIINLGPLNGLVGKATGLLLTSLHRRLFYGILAAVALHLSAILAHRVFFGENLVKPMITGRKPLEDQTPIGPTRLWLAAALVVGLSAILAWVVTHAPVPVSDGFL